MFCNELSARVIELEAGAGARPVSGSERSDFEVISSAPSSSAARGAAAAGVDLPPHRVAAAEKIGAWIQRCLKDQPRGLSGREEIELASRVYLVVRDIHGTTYNPPKVFENWAGAKALCTLEKQLGDSVFVGLPSKAEARIAVSAAGLDIPPALTRHALPMSAEEAEEQEEPEALDLRQHLISSGETVECEYTSGVLHAAADEGVSCSIVAVAEVDHQVLVAIPEAAWHKTRRKRRIDPDALRRPIAVLAPFWDAADRYVADPAPATKIWLGLLNVANEPFCFSDVGQADLAFPIGADGLQRLPYAQALLAVARDHFTFMTAESGSGDRPPGLSGGLVEARLSAVEDGIAEIKHGLAALRGPGKSLPAKAKGASKRPPLPPGVDPAVAQQALQAGVSPGALREMAEALGLPLQPAEAAPAEASSGEEEDAELAALDVGGGSGSADPMASAVLKLTKILAEMHQTKSKTKDRELETILDRAESGYAKDPTSGSTRSKLAALLALQQLLKKNPKLLYTSIEKRLQEDWEQASMQPGIQQNVISARGWLEHRSRVQAFPSTMRAAWTLGGIWDCLRTGRTGEARARAALGVCALDQHACDSGSWLLATELTMESPPPATSFSLNQPPASCSLGTSSHQADRSSLVRSGYVQSQGSSRVPREESKADASSPAAQQGGGGAEPQAKGEGKSERKGRRKREGCCPRCGRDCGQCHCSGVGSWAYSGKHSVPGENAPVVNVVRLWSSLTRWVLRSRTNFAQFLHSYMHNDPAEARGTAAILWPMSAPYNRWFFPGNVAKTLEGSLLCSGRRPST